MIFTINKGRHNHTFWPISFLPWLRFGNTVSVTRRVKFDDNCQYDSPTYNAEDVNKHWGLSFGLLPIRVREDWSATQPDGPLVKDSWVVPEHWNSARFGWVWSVSKQVWKAIPYCYANGVKNRDDQMRYPEVAYVRPGQEVEETIFYNRKTGATVFIVHEVTSVLGTARVLGTHEAQLPPNLPMRGWQLGFYFGGNLTAPQKMSSQINRL